MPHYLEDSSRTLEMPENVISPDKDEMSQLVFEYLAVNGLDRTLATFVEECRNKSLPFPEQGSTFPFLQSDGQKILECFDRGDLRGFTWLWDAFLRHVKVANEDMKKMEVYIRVHFAVFPFTHGRPARECEAAMIELKIYLEDKSNHFSDEIKALPMFSLPYAQGALQRPEFQELIEPDWADKLRYQLETTIFRYFHMVRENMAVQDKYSTVLLKARLNEQVQQQQLKSLTSDESLVHSNHYQQQFNLLTKTFRKVRRLLRGTRESYGRLLKVAFELICGLEASAAGNTTILEPVIQSCYEIFPELFTSDATQQGVPDTEFFKNLAADAFFDSVIDSDVSLFFIGISDMSPDLLNYAKIKETLGSQDKSHGNSRKICLLQALRWLLTRSPNSCKNYAMDSFIAWDLLGLSDTSSEYRNKLFACMSSKTPTYLRECLIRFINCFASMRVGRKYLSSTNFIVDALTVALKIFDAQTEKYNCQMIIAAFQKLSLRKRMRLRMIENGLIQWLTNYMYPEVMKIEITERLPPIQSDYRPTNSNTNVVPLNYSPYLMEFGWALIMNLCLHEEAHEPSAEVGRELIACTLKMLRVKPTLDVMPYVVSTLYNLVRNQLTFPFAMELNVSAELRDIITCGVDGVDEALLESIVRMLKGVERESDRHTGEIDYDDDQEEYEEMEPQIEVPETWVKALDSNALVGDELLSKNYLIGIAEREREIVLPNYKSSANGNGNSSRFQKPNQFIMRPTTPNVSMKTMQPPQVQAPQNFQYHVSQYQDVEPDTANASNEIQRPDESFFVYNLEDQQQQGFYFDRNNNDFVSVNLPKSKAKPPRRLEHPSRSTATGTGLGSHPVPIVTMEPIQQNGHAAPVVGQAKTRQKKPKVAVAAAVATQAGKFDTSQLIPTADRAPVPVTKTKKKLKQQILNPAEAPDLPVSQASGRNRNYRSEPNQSQIQPIQQLFPNGETQFTQYTNATPLPLNTGPGTGTTGKKVKPLNRSKGAM